MTMMSFRQQPLNGVPTGPGRTFSTWDWDRMCYVYYRSPSSSSDQAAWTVRLPARRAVAHPVLGTSVEGVLRRLPADARPIGHGSTARGEIAVKM